MQAGVNPLMGTFRLSEAGAGVRWWGLEGRRTVVRAGGPGELLWGNRRLPFFPIKHKTQLRFHSASLHEIQTQQKYLITCIDKISMEPIQTKKTKPMTIVSATVEKLLI